MAKIKTVEIFYSRPSTKKEESVKFTGSFDGAKEILEFLTAHCGHESCQVTNIKEARRQGRSFAAFAR